jgi:hypothetical protein
MSGAKIDPVVKVIDVNVPCARAFSIFTAEMGAWWPLETHSLADQAKGERGVDVTIEPRRGGLVTERLNTGETRVWGEVVSFEPPLEFSMWWRLGRPADQGTLVTVSFASLGATRTRVTLTHEFWERLGEGAHQVRDNYNQGWAGVFEQRFGRACVEVQI